MEYSDDLRKMLRSAPFVPLTIHLADGAFFPIPHTDFAMLTPTGRTLYLAVENSPVQVINTKQIVRVQTMSIAELAE